jgi:hypothetical protein
LLRRSDLVDAYPGFFTGFDLAEAFNGLFTGSDLLSSARPWLEFLSGLGKRSLPADNSFVLGYAGRQLLAWPVPGGPLQLIVNGRMVCRWVFRYSPT